MTISFMSIGTKTKEILENCTQWYIKKWFFMIKLRVFKNCKIGLIVQLISVLYKECQGGNITWSSQEIQKKDLIKFYIHSRKKFLIKLRKRNFLSLIKKSYKKEPIVNIFNSEYWKCSLRLGWPRKLTFITSINMILKILANALGKKK